MAMRKKSKKTQPERLIDAVIQRHANNKQFNIMDLGKIHKEVTDAYNTGQDLETATHNITEKYRCDKPALTTG